MARLLALNALFFLIPFAIYGAWRLLRRQSVTTAADWPTRRILQLCGVGVVFVIVGLIALVSFSGTSTNQQYHPAELQDGQVVPGRFGGE